jgi:hypothetical protein
MHTSRTMMTSGMVLAGENEGTQRKADPVPIHNMTLDCKIKFDINQLHS